MESIEGCLRVSCSERGEIDANSARLHLSVQGSTFVYGNAALEKSQEVRALVLLLQKAGIATSDITIAAVTTSSESKLLSRTTRAVYQLVVGVAVPSLLGGSAWADRRAA